VNDPVQKFLQLLGSVVLVPIRSLTKRPIGKSWQKRTRESMQDPDYLRSFNGKNIGVLLGKPSGGLCTIDVDEDAEVEPFLARNPRLSGTTRTKRVRGCNLWVYVEGEFPASTKLPFGEWRADGNQTVIHGRAIDKKKGETEPTEYRFLNEVPPIRIRFDEIIFPTGCFDKRTPEPTAIRLNPESCIATSLHDCIPAYLHNNGNSILANIKAKEAAQKALAEKHPKLFELYQRFIGFHFEAVLHGRNDFIVQAVPFLYRAVAPQFILELVGCFYDCNRALFNDPREQHMKEAKAMLESVSKTYLGQLSEVERQIYDALPERERDAFRICRDLALLPNPQREPLTFYMSFNQLGGRLGIYPTQAQRILRQFASVGLVVLLKKGTRRATGVRGDAGEYKWTLIA